MEPNHPHPPEPEPDLPDLPEGPAPEVPGAPEVPALPQTDVPAVAEAPAVPDAPADAEAPAVPTYMPPAVPAEPTRTRFAEPARPPAPVASAQVDTTEATAERTQEDAAPGSPVASAQVDTTTAEAERTQELDARVDVEAPAEPAAAPPEPAASAQVDTTTAEAERTQQPEAQVEPPPGELVAPERAGRRGPVRVLAGLAALLLVATIVLGVVALVRRPSGSLSDTQRASAVTAAKADATKIFSFDYRHLDADFKAGLAVSTGAFKDEYTRTTTKLVQDLVPKYKAVTLAQVSTAGVVSATKDSAVVLVFFNQQASSTLLKAPRVTQNRIEMTMVRSGDGWLVSKIKAL